MNKNQKLLLEIFPLKYDSLVLKEAIEGKGPFRIEAVLQRYGEKNENGRIYPRDVLEREVKRYNTEFVQQHRAVGELDHPESRVVVNLSNVSHNIVEMHWDGDTLVGTLEILTTPSGNIVRELLKGGIRLGTSSRGVGSVKPMGEGTVEVEPDYQLICWDLVSNPSTVGAFLGESVNIHLQRNRSERINSLVENFFSEIAGK